MSGSLDKRILALEKGRGTGALTPADRALEARLAAGDRCDDVPDEALEHLIRATGGTVPNYAAMSDAELDAILDEAPLFCRAMEERQELFRCTPRPHPHASKENTR